MPPKSGPIAQVLIFLVRVYQRTLSLDHGPLKFLKPDGQCRFLPSCSEYAAQALAKHGAMRGSWLALRRVLKCHPWGPFGPDPVP
jgi:putative membrane protein insertion efficiency factor